MVAKGISPKGPTPEQLIRWGADMGPLTLHGEWWRLITACFLHVGIAHIGMNMYSLWQVGRPVEWIYGRARYVLIYAVAGLGGDLASLYHHPNTVSAGASGAIFGVFGAMIAFVLVNRKQMSKTAVDSVLRSAGYVILVNAVIGFSVKEIDLSGHIGGLVVGFLLGCLLAKRNADGTMRLPLVKGLTIAIAAIVLCAVGMKALAARTPGDGKFLKAVISAPNVPLGAEGTLYYTGSATQAEAKQLAKTLALLGLQNAGVEAVWDKRHNATTLSIAVGGDENAYAKTPQEAAFGKEVAPWQQDDVVESFTALGHAVMSRTGGEPYTLVIANAEGEPRRRIAIGTTEDPGR